MSNRCYGEKYELDNVHKSFRGIPTETIYGMIIAKINALTKQYNGLVDELLSIKSKAPFLAVSLPAPDGDTQTRVSVQSGAVLLVNKYNKLVAKYNRLVDEVVKAKQNMDLLLTVKPPSNTEPDIVHEPTIEPAIPEPAIPEPVYITEETYVVQETYVVEETYIVP